MVNPGEPTLITVLSSTTFIPGTPVKRSPQLGWLSQAVKKLLPSAEILHIPQTVELLVAPGEIRSDRLGSFDIRQWGVGCWCGTDEEMKPHFYGHGKP